MKTLHYRRAAAFLAVGVFALSATVSTEVRAQAPAVDPAATKILQRMDEFEHPWAAWVALGVIVVWTALMTWAYDEPRRRRLAEVGTVEL